MKLFYFLLSCIFVNISVEEDANYMRAVVLTNQSIKNAGPQELERAIESLFVETNSAFKDFEKVNLGFAVPDAISDKPREEIDKLTQTQLALGDRIDTVAHMLRPKIEEDQNFGSLNLESLADERRALIGPALKNILSNDLAAPVQHTLDQSALGRSCVLLGFYLSIFVPKKYIKTVTVNQPLGMCTFWDGGNWKTYRRGGRAWMQVTEAEIKMFNSIANLN